MGRVRQRDGASPLSRESEVRSAASRTTTKMIGVAGTLRRCFERLRLGCAASRDGAANDLGRQTVNDRMAAMFCEHKLELPAGVRQAFCYLIFAPVINSTIWSGVLEKVTMDLLTKMRVSGV